MTNGDAKLIARPPLYDKLAPVFLICIGNLLEVIEGIKAHPAFATNMTTTNLNETIFNASISAWKDNVID